MEILGAGEGRQPRSGATRRDATRRAFIAAGILALFAFTASGPIQHLWSLAGAGDWGSDWLWLADGLNRLLAGLPLNHPEYVAGPFSQLADGPTYTWSLHPPYNATLVAPALLLPPDLRQIAWTWLIAAALAGAVWLAWPRGLWWGTNLLVVAILLGPPFIGPSVGLVDQLHFANPNALVLLGVALVWTGRTRRQPLLVAAGVVLAAVKIVPALALVAWLLAARSGREAAVRGVALGGLALALLTIPVVVLDHGVLADTIAVQLNVIPWDGPTNLAPQVRLAPVLGTATAAWLSRIVAAGLLVGVLVRRLDGPGGLLIAVSAALLLTPQLWAHWLLIPLLTAVIAAGEWPAVRRFDARLRTARTGLEDAAARGSASGAPTRRIRESRPVRAVFAVLGTIFLGLAVLGIVLPVLPTTPFLLLAAACYARASTRLHAWLLARPSLGPIIEHWQGSRSLAPGIKRRALVIILATFSVSIILVGEPALRVALAAGGAVLLVFLARLPSQP